MQRSQLGRAVWLTYLTLTCLGPSGCSPILPQVVRFVYGCRYDALIVDLYTGDNPLEMLTAEALGRLKREWLKVWVRDRVSLP